MEIVNGNLLLVEDLKEKEELEASLDRMGEKMVETTMKVVEKNVLVQEEDGTEYVVVEENVVEVVVINLSWKMS